MRQPDPCQSAAIRRRALLSALPGLTLPTALLWPNQGHTQVLSPARLQSWPLNTASSTGIHDVAPAPDGGVWFAAQRSGHLGWFDPRSGKSELIALGNGASPPWGDCRPKWCGLAHRRWAKRHRARGLASA